MNAIVPVTMTELEKMGAAMVKSKLFGFTSIEQAMSIMLIAQAEGRSPALAARDYHVIQGRPALKADAMLARFQQEGGVVEWDEYSDTKVVGRFSHPKSCPKPVAVSWTLDMAKRIGLANKDNWRNYPRAMLRARVISEGVRTAYPGIAVGIYTVEEVQDFGKERDITPTAGAGDDLSEEQRVKVGDLADKVREWMNQGSLTDAWCEIDNAGLEASEQVFLWTHFDSRVRRQLKEEGERARTRHAASKPALESNAITEAQRKRLEARISELGLSREGLKTWCAEQFGKEHFAELTKDEYNKLDAHMEKNAAPPPITSNASIPLASGDGAATITDAEAIALDARCTDNGISVEALRKAAKVERLSMIAPDDLPRAHQWIDKTIEKRKQAAG